MVSPDRIELSTSAYQCVAGILIALGTAGFGTSLLVVSAEIDRGQGEGSRPWEASYYARSSAKATPGRDRR